MAKFFIALVLVSLSFSVNAQRRTKPTPEEIQFAQDLKASYSDEDVVILDKDITVTFQKNRTSGKIEATIDERVSFMNTSPSARIQFPMFYDSESRVEDITLKDKSGRKVSAYVKDEYMKSEDLFHTDYRVKYATISFPVQASKYQVIARKSYKDVKYFTSHYFVDQYRVLKGSLKVIIPEWLELELKEFNLSNYSIEKEEKEEKGKSVIKYTYTELEPRSQEANSPGPSFMYPHVLFIAKSYKTNNGSQALFGDVKDLYGWYNSLAQSVEVDASVFSEKVSELVKNATSDQQKIESIFYWVQDNIRYVAFEDGIAGFKPDSPQNVFTKRYGDCKGMAILTKSMLEEAGFDSRLVWIGTDRLAYDYSIPSLSVDNHMICSVVLNGETIFLDGTEKYSRYGEYATRIQNKQALMQNDDSYTILTVPGADVTSNVDTSVYDLEMDGESLKGTVKRTFGGETRVSFQNVYNSFGKDVKLERLTSYLASGNSNYFVNAVIPFDEENRDKDLEIEYTSKIDNAVTEFDGTIYLDIDPVKRYSNWEFKDRKTDFKHDFQEKTSTKISVKIPEGYNKVELPENLSISNDYVSIQVAYKKEGDRIVYSNEIYFGKRKVEKDSFPEWNAAFAKLKENLNQQITLTKD